LRHGDARVDADDDDIGGPPDELGGKARQLIRGAAQPAKFEHRLAAIDMAEFFQPLVELLWNGARPSGDVDEKPPMRKRLPDLCDRAAIGTNTPVARAAERRRREIIQSPR